MSVDSDSQGHFPVGRVHIKAVILSSHLWKKCQELSYTCFEKFVNQKMRDILFYPWEQSKQAGSKLKLSACLPVCHQFSPHSSKNWLSRMGRIFLYI
jgi:hypothetical protein